MEKVRLGQIEVADDVEHRLGDPPLVSEHEAREFAITQTCRSAGRARSQALR
jgi:hypothetical protein